MIRALRILFLIFCILCSSLQVKAQSFTNPILSGFYPDPSICKAGDDYYIVNSSFSYYPGLPIFHSKDLLNWQLIGYAMNRPEQLNLDGAGVSRGLFAPAISYHNGTFYIVCTLIDKLGNFVITANDPKEPWSNPVALPQVNGIDPALFFDDNGKSYIVFNSIPPDNISLHNGHRTIRMFEFDAVNLKIIGQEKLLINGGTDMAKKPVWIEGPHIIKKDGWYYLLCAEGGTGYNHSEVVFRSKNVVGPYVSYEENPILTQRHLDTNRANPITTTGHADFVEDKEGNWWAVFLGCRPYEGDYYNTGRETFMAPVVWKDGWPSFNLGSEEVKYSYPIKAVVDENAERFNRNFYFRDDFDKSNLNVRYSFLRTQRENWCNLSEKSGSLSITLRPQTCNGTENPSFIGFRQSHLNGYAAVSLNFNANAENEKAGLMIFQNEQHHYYMCKSVEKGKPVLQLYKGAGGQDKKAETELLISIPINQKSSKDLCMKIEADGGKYNFYYALKKGKWILLKAGLDGKLLSTKEAGGFVGSMYAMYATSNGSPSNNKVYFRWFESKSEDTVYGKR